MAKVFMRIRRPSLRWGLIFGLILGIVEIGYNFVTSFITQADLQSLLSYVPTVLFLVLGFYAGLRAARETGKWTSGLVAGIWVGVIGTVFAYLVVLVNILINLQSIVASSQLYIKTHPDQVGGIKPSDYTASDVLITALVGLLATVINSVFFTLIGGALGGFMGRRQALALATPASTEYVEAMFEPLPSGSEAASDEAQEPAEAERKDETATEQL
jgi:hypothetical protein